MICYAIILFVQIYYFEYNYPLKYILIEYNNPIDITNLYNIYLFNSILKTKTLELLKLFNKQNK